MKLSVLDGYLTVWKIPPGESILPHPQADDEFWSLTRTGDEISVVSNPESVPASAESQPGWKALEVAGPLEFSMIGVLASLATPLADAGIPVFVISTFNTDYLLVNSDHLDNTINVLRSAGHEIHLGVKH